MISRYLDIQKLQQAAGIGNNLTAQKKKRHHVRSLFLTIERLSVRLPNLDSLYKSEVCDVCYCNVCESV
jgi:hypothetical protein